MATSQVDLCNRALRRLGTQSIITSLDDGSQEADMCAAFYGDVLGSILESPRCSAYPSYTWQWCRKVASGTSSASNNPRWIYEYTLPADCLRIQEIIDPSFPQKKWRSEHRLMAGVIDYECGVDQIDGTDTPVIWCNLSPLSVLYISDGISIDQWPNTFRRAFWLALAVEIGTGLGISGSIISAISQEADAALAQACQMDMRVSVQITDYLPDWMAARGMNFGRQHWNAEHSLASYPSGFVIGSATANSPIPNYLAPSNSLNGVASMGIDSREIANRDCQYIPGDTPDGRIGVLAIGTSPIGWRRPYHNAITLGVDPGDGETEG